MGAFSDISAPTTLFFRTYAVANTLNEEGTRTRYGKEFKVQTVQNILARFQASTVAFDHRPS